MAAGDEGKDRGVSAGPDLIAELRQQLEERREARARRRRRRFLLAGTGVALLGLVLFLYVFFLALPPSTAHRPGAPVPQGAEDRLFVLIMGIDSPVNVSERTDTMLVASFNPRTGEAGVFSLPRDTRVQVPGHTGYRKLNAAYSLGGPELAAETVSRFLGIPIDHYVVLNFESFAGIVDAVGGVEVTVRRPMRYEDRAQGLFINIPAGTHRLNGEEALGFVRYRADNLGDVALVNPATGEYGGRVQRQLEFVHALAKAALRPEVLVKLPRLLVEYYRTVETDLSVHQITRLARALTRVSPEQVRTGLVPGTAGTEHGVAYWIPDPIWLRSTVAEILLGVERPAVQVVNGKGSAGLAGRVALELKRRGFPVVQVGNAARFGIPQTQIEVPPGWGDEAEALAQELPIRPQLVPMRGEGGSLRLVLGNDFPEDWAIDPADLDRGLIPWEMGRGGVGS